MKKLKNLDKKKNEIPTLEQVKAAVKEHGQAIKDKVKAGQDKKAEIK